MSIIRDSRGIRLLETLLPSEKAIVVEVMKYNYVENFVGEINI